MARDAHKAPGKAHRVGLTLFEVAQKFADEEEARKWIEALRWPDGPHCPDCGTFNVQSDIKGHKTMTHRCRDCAGKPFFSLRKGTIMESSKLPYRAWAVGIYLFTTNLKGISSMKLHRELGIGQKAAWFMLQRLRKAADEGAPLFSGPAEVDETYVGGLRKNMRKSKREKLEGRGPVGKAAVVGIKDRKTKRVAAKAVRNTDGETLRGFVREHVEAGAAVYSDDAGAYGGLTEYERDTVKHSVGEYVKYLKDVDVHTNGIESLWSMFKRGYIGTYHKMSPKHLDRYVAEFTHRQNVREDDTLDQMATLVRHMGPKRLRYRDLIADNGLSSGAREAAA